MSTNCIDVSKYQGSVNWAKVKAAGVKYAIIRSITQGLKTDSYFETNYKGAKAAGMKIGVYLFGYATTTDYAKKEAQSLVKLLNGRKLDLPVFYDLETSGLRTASATTVQKLATAFQTVVEKAGYEFGVYCDEDFYKTKGHFKGFDSKVEFWIAKYGKNDGRQHDLPAIQHHLIGHQFSSKGKVSGISGNVDVSNWYGPAAKAKTAKTSTLYRVRKSWSDEKSQKGAFDKLENAKKLADSSPGYFVFDPQGVAVYPLPYMIQVKTSLAVWSGSTSNVKVDSTGAGTFTITEVKDQRGKLRSGAGWVALQDVPLLMLHDYTVTYKKTGNAVAPYDITVDRAVTPLWDQSKWVGSHKKYIQSNGCGHCGAAMTARLHGVSDITPGTEYDRCVKLWGQPTGKENAYLSGKGIAAVLKSYGVPATYCKVTTSNLPEVKKQITKALKEGKQAILWCHKYSGQDNPFTASNHYVTVMGYDKHGKIVVANTTGGKIQLTDINAIGKALYHSCTGKDTGWGTSVAAAAGVVLVG